ncbi:hypothetical protein FHS23_004087 [Prauserella isguenensis]|uniref:Uncharacterized protein n=1 Tax=Prauserella isguenensis TaxID=1470180 RepID=A0A839S6Q9_9PSEU|nr:hypothetical protein [Prauserella isguenensis]MBB3053044.1 hypothetical protein [Prauserella isguenensis]
MPGANVQLRTCRERMPSRRAPGEPMTRTELAEAVNDYLWQSTGRRSQLDGHTIARYERGAVRWPSAHYRSGLRHVLDADTDAELGFHPTPRGNSYRVGDSNAPEDQHQRAAPRVHDDAPIDAFISDLRRVLERYDMPDDAPVRPLEQLREAVRSVVRWRLNSEYALLAHYVPTLIRELTTATFSATGSARCELMVMLAQTYRAADAIADKFGFVDLSARIITLMRWAASASGHGLTIGMASYVRAETFFATTQFDHARRMLTTAANDLGSGSAPAGHAVYGALHMRAAVAAARAGSPRQADDHLIEASDVARHVPEGLYAGTAFGPGSVRIHRLTLALDLSDLGAALSVAAGWSPPETVPAERRSHYYIDLARAQHQAGRPLEARDALAVARRLAPEHVRVHTQAKALTAALSAR